ncbi:ac transposable element-derived 4 [Paramuricea clavata]|uniref:Ac transposable element-derived 4 n=1 Tax=Paramuricea clavata TaxID=317549 RepID=A0A7D9HNW0_PARCT|nr:ac transposable element-derived 4 [Paramuricea clavata]
MTTSILPSKFERGDLTTWLREYDACAEANEWDAAAKIKKLPAFLRGEAASHFYSLNQDSRKTYADATKALKEAICPPACKEVLYAEFEARLLTPGEDPAVYKWELEQILTKAESNIDTRAKTALLTRHFMKGLPKNIRLKLLESDPTPDLPKMVSFVQRYRAIQDYTDRDSDIRSAGVASEKSGNDMASLVALVSDIAVRQKNLEEKLSKTERDRKPELTQNRSNKKCFVCRRMGHIARDCWYNDQRQNQSQTTDYSNRCYQCQGYGHFAKDCANYLNSKRAIR